MSKSAIANYLSNLRLVFFGYVVVIGVGLMAWLTLPREQMPSINIPVILVSTILPGASPQDVEQLLTVPLEDKIRGVNGIDYVRSTSMENASAIIITFKEGLDVDELTRKVKEKVDTVKLPDNAKDPTIIKADFNEFPVWTFAITGDDKVGLRRVAEQLKKDLERESTIDRVEITGVQDREITVHMDQSKIVKYGINPATLASSIAAATTNVPAGSVNLGKNSYSVSLAKEVTDVDTLRSMSVIVNGVEYRLADIADVYEQEVPGNSNSYQVRDDGAIKQVVTLNVYKTAGADIEANAKLARRVVEADLEAYPQYELSNITDMAQEIGDTFDKLYGNIYATIALVFAVMFVFLGIREATLSALSIPIVMLVTFGGIMFGGMTLNFITLFGLLIALGMLVDNAIVVTTALSRSYFERQNEGITALQAGVDVWKEFFVALLSTNLTTIWAFLPLVIMTGIMGQMVKPVGIVVTIAMVASALVAFLLSLPLGVYILEPRVPVRVQKFILASILLTVAGVLAFFLPKNWVLLPIILVAWLLVIIVWSWLLKWRRLKRERKAKAKPNFLVQAVQKGFISTAWLENSYSKVISAVIRTRRVMITTIICIVILTIAAFSLPLIGWVHSEFFPKEEADYFQVTWTLPVGTNTDEADRIARELLPQIAEGVLDLEYITAEVGRTTSSSVMGGATGNKILFTVNLIPEKQRESSSIQTASDFRKRWEKNPYGTIEVEESSSVSTGGSDLSMYIIGDDLDVLAQKAEAMTAWLKQQPGVVDVRSDLDSTSIRLVFYPNTELATQYGLSNSSLALWLRSTLSGWTLGSLKLNEDDDKDTDIVLRQQEGQPDITSLDNIQVPISGVGYVPLESLGDVRVEPSMASIYRYNYKHSVQVNAGVESGYSSTEINRAFEEFIDKELGLPAGYSRQVSGSQDANDDALSDLAKAMVIAFILILITLVIQLRSFRKAFIVMSVIPVAISGVFINFALLGWTLNLPAVIGILSLFGIVVNNSILIIERINQNLDEGKQFINAVVDGCVSRLQPILLTSMTTIIGLLPITLSDPLWQGLGGTIICGLTFSGILLLLYIPALFVLMFEPRYHQNSDDKWRQLVTNLAK